ncbi:MAG: ACT domain-containing protein, partial [Cellulosilyticum sp.]|nr:ACT domain-containing protein [Cellulosilyticum sp.]
ISIDLINIFPHEALFTVDIADQEALSGLLEKHSYKYEMLEHCAKVTTIGERMTGVPGVMARIVCALSKEKIEIYQTADSLTTIACLIKEEHVAKAIDVLHDEFHL